MKLTIMYCILRSIILTSHGYTTQSYSQTPLHLNLTTCSFYSRINGTTAYCLHLINSTIRFAKNVEETSCSLICCGDGKKSYHESPRTALTEHLIALLSKDQATRLGNNSLIPKECHCSAHYLLKLQCGHLPGASSG